MISKALVLVGLFSGKVFADVEHLDIELVVEGGERQLFPLLPGTKCPTGHTCRARTAFAGVTPMVSSLKSNLKTPLAVSMDWQELNNELDTVVTSDEYCTRRNAMARAAGLAAGLSAAAVTQPAYAAETKEVKMGTDSGGLQFVPAKVTICKGDSVKWINNKGGPHNVVFDEEDIPSGVDQEKISMDDQLGDEGATYVVKFDVAGDYGYFCEPHRGAGMNAKLIVQ
jgi:plastocyanin